MANVLLLAAFLLSNSFPTRAQDTSIIISTTNTEALERQIAETREETGRLQNQVDRLSSLVETLLVQEKKCVSRVDRHSAEVSSEKDRSARSLVPTGQTTTNTEAPKRRTKEETGRLNNRGRSKKVDRLSSLVETLLSRVDSLSAELSEERVRGAQLERNLTRRIQELEIQRCCAEPTIESPAPPADCAAYKSSGLTSGVYPLGSLPSGVQAYCDMETAGGGWTVIQRRLGGSVPFNRTWEEYKLGFGNKDGEYWLGNENIHLLTNQKEYSLRIELQDWEGNQTFAEYSTFRVSDESDQYRLHISGYSGTAGDSLDNNGGRFSTVDRDNDVSNIDCSQLYGQGGWWYRSCGNSFLNGPYLGNCGNTCPLSRGVMWYHWRGGSYSLKSVSMKIREETDRIRVDRLSSKVDSLGSSLKSVSMKIREETDRVKVDRLSSVVETLQSQQSDLTSKVDRFGDRLRDQETRLQSQLSILKAFHAEADCAAYKSSGQTTSGVYTLGSLPSGVQAYCDMDTAGGGWTVIQRRQDGSVPFNRTWEEYKLGFGNKSGEYWLGNENIHLLTNQKDYVLRIDLQDWEEKQTFAEYSTFRVSGESDGYRLHISGYSGTAGDSMAHNNGRRFSTVDRDNDVSSSHCSQQYGQGGWWFRACSWSLLNGHYLGNCGNSCPFRQGVMWYGWRGVRYSSSLKSVSMKLRPA
ncbi:angiopoietin-4-like isoform X2 [Branchiostoma floridae]|uniref:Angiopoietin-4-like isoform X2 n=1 Tax=Branchiostoma floridae TaxID=7739 RepID=A0A9J7NBR5_BRAFL|nr:angiopoietin-4-like isoform X2 [Branchiostoma floridae]